MKRTVRTADPTILPWDDDALEHVGGTSELVRGMVIKEVEACTRRKGAETVSMRIVDSARRAWQEHGVFRSKDIPQPYSGC